MTAPPLLTPPIALYNNFPIEAQNYQPSQFFISGVANGQTTTVTTTVNHNYVIGQLVRLLIPNGYGCRQLNEQTGNVIAIPAANQVTLDLFSLYADNFVNANLDTKPQIVAVGGVNQGYISSTGVNIPSVSIPGSFINISP